MGFGLTVKFDGDSLPPILNALECDNGGQKLILEVAVSFTQIHGNAKGNV